MRTRFINRLQRLLAVLTFAFLSCMAAGAGATARQDFVTLKTATTAITSSNITSQLTQLHNTFKTYQWRTVYELSQVSKTPLPGTRLAVTAIATMSQLDAENYLNTYVFNNTLPALNCPAAQMGGSPGRTMPQEDGQHLNAMKLAGPGDAVATEVYNVYINLRNAVCQAIYNTAQLQFRLDKYTNLKNNWTECSNNGIQLTAWTYGRSFSFNSSSGGNYTRTVNIGGGILYKCGAVYTGATTDPLTYDSWFKWSDDTAVPLNFAKMIKEATDTPETNCPSLCIPVVGGAGVSANLCVGISPGISAVTSDTVPLKVGASLSYTGTSKSLCSPVINVPAPFGVAQSLNEMADSAKTQALTNMKSQLTSLLPTMSDAATKVDALIKWTL